MEWRLSRHVVLAGLLGGRHSWRHSRLQARVRVDLRAGLSPMSQVRSVTYVFEPDTGGAGGWREISKNFARWRPQVLSLGKESLLQDSAQVLLVQISLQTCALLLHDGPCCQSRSEQAIAAAQTHGWKRLNTCVGAIWWQTSVGPRIEQKPGLGPFGQVEALVDQQASQKAQCGAQGGGHGKCRLAPAEGAASSEL